MLIGGLLLSSCASVDCSAFDPARNRDIFSASGGIFSKCYEQRIKDKQGNIAAERQTATAQTQRAQDLEREQKSKSAEVARLEREVLALKTDADKVRGEIAELNAVSEGGAEKIALMQAEISRIDSEITKLEQEKLDSQADLASYRRRVEKLRSELTAVFELYKLEID
jgi:septal ring factor EnvC (AmiA/AmiB activator)